MAIKDLKKGKKELIFQIREFKTGNLRETCLVTMN